MLYQVHLTMSWIWTHNFSGDSFVCLFVCLIMFNITFNNILYRGGHFHWERKPEDPEKTTDLSQVTEKLYHIMLYTLPWLGFKLTTSVVIGTDCIGSYKSNHIRSRPRQSPILQWNSKHLSFLNFNYQCVY